MRMKTKAALAKALERIEGAGLRMVAEPWKVDGEVCNVPFKYLSTGRWVGITEDDHMILVVIEDGEPVVFAYPPGSKEVVSD